MVCVSKVLSDEVAPESLVGLDMSASAYIATHGTHIRRAHLGVDRQVHESCQLEDDRDPDGIGLMLGDEFRNGINQLACQLELLCFRVVVLLLRGCQHCLTLGSQDLPSCACRHQSSCVPRPQASLAKTSAHHP